jgi:RNA polymerase sigma-70 factor, ECF subfamily
VPIVEGEPRTLTLMLQRWRAGDASVADELMKVVYGELHRLAGRFLRGERPGHTLHPTDLVSEAYLRLTAGVHPEWNDRVHFYAIAARTMRQILVDHARKRGSDKRGSGARAVTFDDDLVAAQRPDELIALDDALAALAKVDERKARAIELCYFGGLSHAEIAEILEIHVNTVARDLRLAEAWIHRHLRADEP